MATLPVYDKSGSEVGSYDVDPTTIAANINKQLLHDVVIMYQANSRQGSFGTKSRGMVQGSGRKMYRQKGTGNARAGSRRSGVRRGGGHIHKKQDRSFYYRLPAKAVRAATRMAIASKIQDEQIQNYSSNVKILPNFFKSNFIGRIHEFSYVYLGSILIFFKLLYSIFKKK